MKIQGAIVKEQNVTFAIVVVKPLALQSTANSDKTREGIQAEMPVFASVPLILAAQDANGVFSYQGRQDIVSLLASIPEPLSQIPWMEYTFQ